jgi:hypothetical protein
MRSRESLPFALFLLLLSLLDCLFKELKQLLWEMELW